MSTLTIDALAYQAARMSRRRSLLTLGGALAAATTGLAVEPGLARKRNNRNKNKNKGKNGKNGKGADCQKREKQRCNSDAAACKLTIEQFCNQDNVDQCIALQSCCDECSAGGFLTCFIARQQV
jgi:hypothetical protein